MYPHKDVQLTKILSILKLIEMAPAKSDLFMKINIENFGRNLPSRNMPIGYVDPSGHSPCEKKQDLYKKYREQGYNAAEAYLRDEVGIVNNNVPKSGRYPVNNNVPGGGRYSANSNVPEGGKKPAHQVPKGSNGSGYNTQKSGRKPDFYAGPEGIARTLEEYDRYVKSGSTTGKVWDYSKQFDGELANFNAGYEIKNVIDEDLYLV